MLRLAIPSKGALEEGTDDLFQRCLIPIMREQSGRSYTASLRGISDVEITLARANEIPALISEGRVHAGITGLDLVREAEAAASEALEVLLPNLGFGRAELVVAVPKFWIDVTNIGDLVDVARETRIEHREALRVATKFDGLTRNFFASVGLTDYRIVHSLGATEAAPRGGTADIVVDLSSTGTTIESNGLKVLDNGTILVSTACLVVSSDPSLWSSEASARRFARIAGLVEAALRSDHSYRISIDLDEASGSAKSLLSMLRNPRESSSSGMHLVSGTISDLQLDEVLSAVEALGGVCTIQESGLVVDRRKSVVDEFLQSVDPSAALRTGAPSIDGEEWSSSHL